MADQFRTNGAGGAGAGAGGGTDSKRNGETGAQVERRRAAGRAADNGLFAELSIGDVFRIVFRHRRIAMYFFAAVMIVTAGYVALSPKQYRSEAKLFVRLGRENVGLDATTTLGQTPPMTIPVSREEEMNTVVEVLSSPSLAEKVVDALGAETILKPSSHPVPGPAEISEKRDPKAEAVSAEAQPADDTDEAPGLLRGLFERLGLVSPLSRHERAVVALRKHLDIEAVKKSNVILVAYEGTNAQAARKIVAKLIDYYLDEHVRMNRTPRAHQFLKEQASALKAKLAKQEDQMRLLKNSTGLTAPAEQRQTLVLQIGRLEDELKTAQSTAAAAEAETRQLAKRLAGMSPTQVLGESAGYPNMAADGMRQQLYALQLKEKDLASRVTDEHPELKFVRQQLVASKAVLDKVQDSRTQTTVGPNRTYEELRLAQLRQEAVLTSLRAKSTTVEKQLAETRRQLQNLNDNEVKISQIQRDIQILDVSYRKYADSLEQARIDESLERERISNINVAQAPTLNHQPVRPKPLMTLFLGLAVALFGAFCTAFAVECFDHSLKTPEEIERRLRLPVLATIPNINGERFSPRTEVRT